MMFYMAVRYEGDERTPDLELNDKVSNGSTPFIGRISRLLEWNREDPVDPFESHRNEIIFERQGNRNPFIDHPEFADKIWQRSRRY
jgi:endonuclease I